MTMFRLGDLDDWAPLDAGTVMAFDVADGPAGFSIRLLAGAPVDVFAQEDGGELQLVGSGQGNIVVRFTARAPFELSAVPHDAATPAEVWVKGRRSPQVVPESDVPSFATIEPRGIRPHDNVRRMMRFMEINNRRREDILRAEVARLGARVEAQTAQRAAPVPSDAAPPPEPSGAPD